MLKQTLSLLRKWHKNGRLIACATVVSTWSSSPRPVGSWLFINDALEISGSVSGGCVENEVIELALSCMQSGVSIERSFAVVDEKAWSVGLTCGGKITVFIQPIDAHWIESFTKAHHVLMNRKPAYLFYNPSQHTTFLLSSDELDRKTFYHSHATLYPYVHHGVGGYLHVLTPPPLLWIFGAVHIATHLTKFAFELGFQISVIDPRSIFNHKSRFKNAKCFQMWPDTFLDQHPIDSNTFICTLNHDPKFDDIVIIRALDSDACYIGALGSEKTHKKRLLRLSEHDNKIDQRLFSRIHAPIGLKLGNNSASHIALGIITEMVSIGHKKAITSHPPLKHKSSFPPSTPKDN